MELITGNWRLIFEGLQKPRLEEKEDILLLPEPSCAPELKILRIEPNGGYTWKVRGYWQVSTEGRLDCLWLLENSPARVGTKYLASIQQVGDVQLLILSEPEDFKYLGNGNYFFFQFSAPDDVKVFLKV